MSFRDEYLGTRKTYAEYSIEKTIQTGFRANQVTLNDIQKSVQMTFEHGVQQLSRSQEKTTQALQNEVTFQMQQLQDQIRESTSRSTEQIASQIQQMSDYLGMGLANIRWALERQTIISIKILQQIMESLSNESRQYYEQGIKCYDSQEYPLAKERLEKALAANSTNYFAYEYLGFLAVEEDNPEEAIRNFDRARKFAETESAYHCALAASHLARSYYVTQKTDKAIEWAEYSTIKYPNLPKFWYDLATYYALTKQREASIAALRKTIQRDMTFWSVVAIDTNFDPIRNDVIALQSELRNIEKENAHQALRKFSQVVDLAQKAGMGTEVNAYANKLSDLEQKNGQENIFYYLFIAPEAAKSCSALSPLTQQFLLNQKEKLLQELRRLEEDWHEQASNFYRLTSELRHEEEKSVGGHILSVFQAIFVTFFSYLFALILFILSPIIQYFKHIREENVAILPVAPLFFGSVSGFIVWVFLTIFFFSAHHNLFNVWKGSLLFCYGCLFLTAYVMGFIDMRAFLGNTNHNAQEQISSTQPRQWYADSIRRKLEKRPDAEKKYQQAKTKFEKEIQKVSALLKECSF